MAEPEGSWHGAGGLLITVRLEQRRSDPNKTTHIQQSHITNYTAR